MKIVTSIGWVWWLMPGTSTQESMVEGFTEWPHFIESISIQKEKKMKLSRVWWLLPTSLPAREAEV